MAVRRVAVAVVALSALVACSSKEPIAPAPLDSTSPEATASATPTEPAGPPPMPDEARGTGRKAAVAFVRHWIDTLNYSAEALDTSGLEPLTADECAGCQGAIGSIDKVAERGGEFIDQRWDVYDVYVANVLPDMTQVQAVVDVPPSQVRLRRGAKWRQYDGGRMFFIFNLAKNGSDFEVRDLTGSEG